MRQLLVSCPSWHNTEVKWPKIVAKVIFVLENNNKDIEMSEI